MLGVDEPDDCGEISIKAFWWNIAAAPLGKEKGLSVEELESLVMGLCSIISTLDVDALCLGEVSRRILESLAEKLADTPYKIFNGVEKVDRVSFDSCVVYNSSKIAYQDSTPIVLPHVSATQKISHRLAFEVVDTKELLFLYVLHWPSRLRHSADSPYRINLGVNLRGSLDLLFRKFGEDVNVIILGDFNDEPYNDSMTVFLRASRDRELVRKRSNEFYFYNPFWCFLSHPEKYCRNEGELARFGTYVFSSTEVLSESHVFDQMLFSSSFIGKGPWYLEEESVRVLDSRDPTVGEFISAVGSDHMPIFAEIRRVCDG